MNDATAVKNRAMFRMEGFQSQPSYENCPLFYRVCEKGVNQAQICSSVTFGTEIDYRKQ